MAMLSKRLKTGIRSTDLSPTQNLSGYIACEDFVPQEAYIKYFGTSGETGRNLFKKRFLLFSHTRKRMDMTN